MTVHPHNDQQTVLPHPSTAALLIPNPKRLSRRNPFDYLRLLYWVIMQPDILRAYRIRLNVPQREVLKSQAATLALALTWLPLLVWTAVLWMLQIVTLATDTAVIAGGMALLTWGCCQKYGRMDNSPVANKLLISTMFSGFGLAALLAQALYAGTEQSGLVLGLGLVSLLAVLGGMCVAMVFKFSTIEKMTGIMSLLIMGVLSIIMFNLLSSMWFPIIVVVGAILWVGVTEERHGLVNNQSN